MPSEIAKRMNDALAQLRLDVGTLREDDAVAVMRALIEEARGQCRGCPKNYCANCPEVG